MIVPILSVNAVHSDVTEPKSSTPGPRVVRPCGETWLDLTCRRDRRSNKTDINWSGFLHLGLSNTLKKRPNMVRSLVSYVVGPHQDHGG